MVQILTSVYQVETYQEYKTEIVESNLEKNFWVLEMKDPPFVEDLKLKLIYSDKDWP